MMSYMVDVAAIPEGLSIDKVLSLIQNGKAEQHGISFREMSPQEVKSAKEVRDKRDELSPIIMSCVDVKEESCVEKKPKGT